MRNEEIRSVEQVRQHQKECPKLNQIRSCLESKVLSLQACDRELAAQPKELPNCFIGTDGIIRRKKGDGKTQIIAPEKLTFKILKMMHDQQADLGYSKTLKRTQERYLWPRMSSQIGAKGLYLPKTTKSCPDKQSTVTTNYNTATWRACYYGYCRISIKSPGISLLPHNDRSFYKMFGSLPSKEPESGDGGEESVRRLDSKARRPRTISPRSRQNLVCKND